MIYKAFFKRAIDFIMSLVLALLLIPVFILLIIVLYFANNKAGVFFFQERPGKNGVIFKLMKFKTMNDNKDPHGNLLPSSQRITKFGGFVRKYSLDELPQLFNVIKGDMSVIGPRPLLVQYLSLYDENQSRRHEVRPGITGWAQVNGRNAISWAKKFELDVWYVDNASFLLDLKILYLTFKKVMVGADVNASDSSTMPTFKGNN